MATITEDYVSFETAKLLEEKGFDEDCQYWYEDDSLEPIRTNDDYGSQSNSSHVSKDFICAVPTHQMAMKWLREVHNLFIQICIIPHTTITMEQKYYFFTIHKDRRTLAFRKDFPSEYYFTYEEACEEAIKYCLKNLI